MFVIFYAYDSGIWDMSHSEKLFQFPLAFEPPTQMNKVPADRCDGLPCLMLISVRKNIFDYFMIFVTKNTIVNLTCHELIFVDLKFTSLDFIYF